MTQEITIRDLPKTASVEEIADFIDGSIKRTTEQVLETGYGFFLLSEACNREKKPFGDYVKERYNLNKTNASRWVKIGTQYDLLMKHRHILPSSYSTIYSLLTIPKKGFSELVDTGQINPSTTFEEAEHFKAIYKADTKAKKEVKKLDEDANPFDIPTEPKEVNTKSKPEEKSEREPDIIDGEFEEVKEKKKDHKKTMSFRLALQILEINLDDQFLLAKRTGKYTDELIIAAIAKLSGE